MAFEAMVVVLPVWRPMQATMRFDLSFSSFCWYVKGVKLRRSSAKRVGSSASFWRGSVCIF